MLAHSQYSTDEALICGLDGYSVYYYYYYNYIHWIFLTKSMSSGLSLELVYHHFLEMSVGRLGHHFAPDSRYLNNYL